MNCAATTERKPVALAPSANIPFKPHTERKEQLKIYGEAPDTVSVSIVTVAASTFGFGGRFAGTNSKEYVNFFLSVGSTPVTIVETLYLATATPFILIGVPLFNP